jgi:hypothetical protein
VTIILGRTVKDRLTGFSGVATGRSEYIYRSPQVLVDPCDFKDGKPLDGIWLDESRLVELDDTKAADHMGFTPPIMEVN